MNASMYSIKKERYFYQQSEPPRGGGGLSANNTASIFVIKEILSHLVGSIVALVADSDESAGPHIRVTDDTLPVILLTESTWADKNNEGKTF